jgi:hypothetical protein
LTLTIQPCALLSLTNTRLLWNQVHSPQRCSPHSKPGPFPSQYYLFTASKFNYFQYNRIIKSRQQWVRLRSRARTCKTWGRSRLAKSSLPPFLMTPQPRRGQPQLQRYHLGVLSEMMVISSSAK